MELWARKRDPFRFHPALNYRLSLEGVIQGWPQRGGRWWLVLGTESGAIWSGGSELLRTRPEALSRDTVLAGMEDKGWLFLETRLIWTRAYGYFQMMALSDVETGKQRRLWIFFALKWERDGKREREEREHVLALCWRESRLVAENGVVFRSVQTKKVKGESEHLFLPQPLV